MTTTLSRLCFRFPMAWPGTTTLGYDRRPEVATRKAAGLVGVP